jgi:hypothetical protein
MADRVVKCPCDVPIADLRVVRTTSRPDGIERERRCAKGHRVMTLEVGRFLRRRARAGSNDSASASETTPEAISKRGSGSQA